MSGMMRSMMRFSWAMSLFGVRQAQEMAQALGAVQAPRRASTAFDSLARAAEQQLGDGFRDAYLTGDRWQGQLIDALFGAVDPAVDLSRNLTSRTVVRGSLAVLRQSAGMLEAAMPGGMGSPWRELRNKLEAFDTFQYADQILGFRELNDGDLREQLEEVGGRGSALRLWLTEGLGFAFTEAVWEEGEPRELLRRRALAGLPEESLIPLHTGMGLSLARRVLPDLTTGDVPLEAGLEHFFDLCERNSRDGFALASFEALGLIVRQLAPDKGSQVADVLAGMEGWDDRYAAFWHGVGRGLYFVVTQALPGSTGRAVEKIRQEASTEIARRNALAGLAWALTLVNFRQPVIVDEFLGLQQLSEDELAAVSHGIVSASLLWHDAASDEASLDAFRGGSSSGERSDLWRRWVQAPCAEALASWKKVKSGPGAGSIFINL